MRAILSVVALIGASTAAAFLPGTHLAAQAAVATKLPAWKKDPYTQGDPKIMARVGCVSFGPFPWGDDHDSLKIEKMLPTVRLLWVETAHFKIGSALPAMRQPRNRKRRRELQAELTRLGETLPGVGPRAKKLDPWLRLHLFARRLETVYADFSDRLGVADADFPEGPGDLVRDRYMGEGPYLGMRSKYTVLLFDKISNLGRYTLAASGARQPRHGAHSLCFHKQDGLFIGTAAELADGSLRDDHALHCHVVYCLMFSLVNGYRHYAFQLPVWCSEGIAHWYVHRLDPTKHSFRGMKGGLPRIAPDPRWELNIRRLVKVQAHKPAPKLLRIMNFNQLEFEDHMASWSRIDFLMQQGKDQFAVFMARLKQRIPVADHKVPSQDKVLLQQEAALQEAFGLDLASFDQKWAAYVLEHYQDR